jgi:type VI secretion system protein ImpF
MVDETAREILQPALLDRLLDDGRSANSRRLPERRAISMRKLREIVLRDLSWLLNTTSLDSAVSLERYPLVARSVINYGLPALVGHTHGTVENESLAERMQQAIEAFEPRLTAVRVTPEFLKSPSSNLERLSFHIEAELWGDPLPQHLQLRTQIEVATGNARLEDLGG